MDRPEASRGLTPSVLDRLIDPDAAWMGSQRGYSPRQMIESVRRDLEDLLNTHEADSGIPEEFTEVRSSIVAFGLPDMPSITVRTHGDPRAIRHLITEIITRFEPRLRDLKVSVVETGKDDKREVRFQVEGRVNVDPAPEVAFETVLEMNSGQATVRINEG